MAIVSVGIDLAKNIFAVHGVDESGKPAPVRPSVSRAKLLELIALLEWMPVLAPTIGRTQPAGLAKNAP